MAARRRRPFRRRRRTVRQTGPTSAPGAGGSAPTICGTGRPGPSSSPLSPPPSPLLAVSGTGAGPAPHSIDEAEQSGRSAITTLRYLYVSSSFFVSRPMIRCLGRHHIPVVSMPVPNARLLLCRPGSVDRCSRWHKMCRNRYRNRQQSADQVWRDAYWQ